MVAINRNQSCSIRSRGGLIDDKKDGHEEQGERALHSLDRTGLYREYGSYPAEPQGHEHGKEHDHDHAEKPTTPSTPISVPTVRKTTPLQKAQRDHAGQHPSQQCHGTHRGEREPVEKPLSMSRARSAPAVIAPNREACMRGKANAKSR